MIRAASILAALVVAAALGAAGAWHWQALRYEKRLEAISRESEAQSRAAETAARKAEQALTLQYEKALNDATARESVLRASAGDARRELDGLRGQLEAIGASLPNLAPGPLAVRAATLAKLFAECGRDLQELAATADRLENDRRTLIEAWPR